MRRWLLFFEMLLCVGTAFGQDASVMGEKYEAYWNADLQKEIDARIEKYRKANAQVQLSGVQPGSTVRVEQVEHAFQFGAHLFNFDQLGSDERNRKYKALYGKEKLFNAGTLAFYWKKFEPEPGKPRFYASENDAPEHWNQLAEPWKDPYWRRPSPEKIIAFCEANGVAMHGHPIIWGNRGHQHPNWISLEPDKVDEMERLFRKRVQELAAFYKDRIPSWDVVNESVDPIPGKPRYGVMPEDYTFRMFQEAAKDFPASVKLNINDSWRAVYPPFIQDLVTRGAKIDVVGLQMHIFGSQAMRDVCEGKDVFPNNTSWKPRDVIQYLTELDKFGKPIHISEITIPAPGDDERANAMQARLTRDMYRLWFSWPSVYRITWWNVVDDCGASGEPLKSGLFTRQMEPKPVYRELERLIHHEWKTSLRHISSSDEVRFTFRGFKGRYRITWTALDGTSHTQFIEVN
ncbi:MAG: endo-1,4-beta-xylanase [Planctomycetia bacterium]|nr:endo-1,4-beta-xylanase [Planctomycetia bacterium]